MMMPLTKKKYEKSGAKATRTKATRTKEPRSELIFLDALPHPRELATLPFLFFDQRLLKNKSLKKWIELFPMRTGVKAGEELKQIGQLEKHFINCLKQLAKAENQGVTFVSLGGGSVGDFVGFLASVFKRGSPLIHLPSTWLAAIDSSHGGKTALNVAGYKNQMGTFYFAEKIFLIKDLLFTQPAGRVNESMGEILKTVLLSGGALWRQASIQSHLRQEELWKLLPALIHYKYSIVNQDPLEKEGTRRFLNLGHTYGHVLESVLGLPHGRAVNYGLRLALELSLERQALSARDYQKILSRPLFSHHLVARKKAFRAIGKVKNLMKFLIQDKKASKEKRLRFVLLKKPGHPCVEEISVDELVEFAMRGSLDTEGPK